MSGAHSTKNLADNSCDLSQYPLSLAALTEIRLAEEESQAGQASDYTFFWNGKERLKDKIQEAVLEGRKETWGLTSTETIKAYQGRGTLCVWGGGERERRNFYI